MKPIDPDKPTYSILMAVRASMKDDHFYGQAKGLAASRARAHVASRNRQAAMMGLTKLRELERPR